ncbi:MAG: FecR family protein [Opitutales bacterium]
MISFLKHLGMVALAFLPLVSSAALQSGKVQVGKITGTATLIDAKSQRKPLQSGAVFQEGSRVETGIDSTAELVFSNGASLVLTPSTLVELRTFRQVPSDGITDPYRQIEKDPSPSVTEVEVPRGKVIGEVRKLNALSTFTVKTPAGLVRIRGTVFSVEYRVGSDGLGKVVVSCVRGSVETTVFSSNAGPVSVDPGMQTSSSVPSAALISSLARAGAPAAPATAAAALSPVKVLLFPIPAEDLAQLSSILAAASTLPPEVASTIAAMAQTAPSRQAIFPNGAAEPAKAFGQVITDAPAAGADVAQNKAGAPGAPVSSSNGGGGTTMDDNLKRISDNVNRSVEQKQINPTPTS